MQNRTSRMIFLSNASCTHFCLANRSRRPPSWLSIYQNARRRARGVVTLFTPLKEPTKFLSPPYSICPCIYIWEISKSPQNLPHLSSWVAFATYRGCAQRQLIAADASRPEGIKAASDRFAIRFVITERRASDRAQSCLMPLPGES